MVSCDFCKKNFERKRKQTSRFLFCNRKCMNEAAKRGGILFEAKKQTCLLHFGFESQNSSPDVKETKRLSCLQKYGVENPFQIAEVKQQIKNDLIQKYGVEFSSQIPDSRIKFKKTCIERFGTENPLQNHDIFKKVQRSRKISKILLHWKTCEELVCTASYEVAVVNWANEHQIDFDWQIAHKMPDGKTYFVDLLIKTGEFANTWIEIKGYMTEGSRKKWEWFHNLFSNSQLWDTTRLKELKII